MNILPFSEAIAKVAGACFLGMGDYLRTQMGVWLADRQLTNDWQPTLRFRIGACLIKFGIWILGGL